MISLRHQDAMKMLQSLDDLSVDLIATDPPYSGMNQHLQFGRGRIVGEYAEGGDGGDWFEEWSDDPVQYEEFLEECHRVLKDDRHLFLMFDPYSLLTLGHLVRRCFNVKNVVTWDKVAMGMGHYFRRRSEFILFACKGKRGLTNKSTPDVWQIKRVFRPEYPTQKPVELFERMIECSVAEDEREGFVLCDPFMGSGSSAVAAYKMGCDFIGSDIAERAIEITKRRIDEV